MYSEEILEISAGVEGAGNDIGMVGARCGGAKHTLIQAAPAHTSSIESIFYVHSL